MSDVPSLGPGPVVVVGRPLSGSRVLAGLLRAGGIFMGADVHKSTLDSYSWYQRFVVPLVTSRFFPDWGLHSRDDAVMQQDLAQFCEELLRDTWARYSDQAAPDTPWGWKYCESMFTLPVLRRLFPEIRVVHIVRDGRDVCVSHEGRFQVTGDLADPPSWNPPSLGTAARPFAGSGRPSYREFCFAVAFSDAAATSWGGIDLGDPAARMKNRYLLQMQAWRSAVELGRHYGAELGDDYREVHYEELCVEGHRVAGELFEWLGWPSSRHRLISFVDSHLHTRRIGAWRREPMTLAERQDFDRACELGARLLEKFGYT